VDDFAFHTPENGLRDVGTWQTYQFLYYREEGVIVHLLLYIFFKISTQPLTVLIFSIIIIL